MRFYLDENLSGKIAEIGRARGLDIRSSHECDQNGTSDEQQLKYAAAEGRCFVTRNPDDLVTLTVRFFEAGWAHSGVLIVPASFQSSRFSAVAESLALYKSAHPDGLLPYTIDFLS